MIAGASLPHGSELRVDTDPILAQNKPQPCDLLPREYAALLCGAAVAPSEMRMAVADVLEGDAPLTNADLRAMISAAAEACGASIADFLAGRATRATRRRHFAAGRPGGSLAERVKATFRVEDIAARLTDLRPGSRGSLKGFCPLHSERTPSFVVWPESQRWRCFGACAAGGDVWELWYRARKAGLRP